MIENASQTTWQTSFPSSPPPKLCNFERKIRIIFHAWYEYMVHPLPKMKTRKEDAVDEILSKGEIDYRLDLATRSNSSFFLIA